MNNDQLNQHLLAIRKRRQLLDGAYSRNGRAPGRAGLVNLSHAVFILATRYIMRPEWPGHDVDEATKMQWELQWYLNYVQALEELTPRLQAAVRDGRITPRGYMTRAPLDLEQMRQWLDIDAKAVIAAGANVFWADHLPHGAETPLWAGWADASLLPGGACVTVNEFAEWAEWEGIAAPGDVAAMLSEQDATPALSGTTEKAAPEVTPDDGEKGEAAMPTTAFRPRVAWQVALFDAWPAICKTHGRAPSPAEAVRWMKRNDDSGTILDQGTNVEMWWQPLQGKPKKVTLGAVKNAISDWRVKGVIPA